MARVRTYKMRACERRDTGGAEHPMEIGNHGEQANIIGKLFNGNVHEEGKTMKLITKNGLCILVAFALMLMPVMDCVQDLLPIAPSVAAAEAESTQGELPPPTVEPPKATPEVATEKPTASTDTPAPVEPTGTPEVSPTASEQAPTAPATELPEVPEVDPSQAPEQPATEAPATEAPATEQPKEETIRYSKDMEQFIPNADYGLFLVNSNGKLVSLDGKTLTLGKEYILAMSFRVDRPVLANETYTYRLPDVLTGNDDAAAQTLSNGSGNIAKCWVDGNKLKVVFTELAAETLKSGDNALLITYKFKEKLDADEVGDETEFKLYLPKEKGDITIEFKVDGHPVAQPEETIEPTVEPTEVPSEELAPADEEIEETAVRQITVTRSMPDIIRDGEAFQLSATLIGFEDVTTQVQWQQKTAEGWQDVEGDGLTLQVTANAENVNYDWRILVTITGQK